MNTVKNAIQTLLGWHRQSVYSSRFINNSVAFSSFGNDVHYSDIVKTAIHRVASEVAKCDLRSVMETQNPRQIVVVDDDINAVFSSRVNQLCALRDFLYKVAYLTIVNRNCFIYWAYDEQDIGDGYVKRVTRGFYPIEHASVRLYSLNGEMRVELTNAVDDVVLDMPYSDVIHVRYDFGANRFLGGDVAGRADFRELLKNLQTISVIKEAIPKSLEASLSLKGVLSMKSVGDAYQKKITRDEFEEHLFDSKRGIVATDYEADFTPVNIQATDIPPNILSFVRDDILAPFGVSLPIYLGKYTDDDYTAFYQTAVEPLLAEIAEAFKITLFTPRQLAIGRRIKYYDRLVQSLSFARRQQIAEMTKEDALLSRAERRELLGYAPDGQPTRVSLNYIDESIANKYQLAAIDRGENPAKTVAGTEGNNAE